MENHRHGNKLFRLYLQDLQSCPSIPREDEKRLARRAQQGDSEALARLVSANLPFVVSVSRLYGRRGVSHLDLVNEGNLALMEAALRYDPDRGTTFLTYAVWWIRKAMMRVLRDHSLVRMPDYRHRLERRVRQTRREMAVLLGRSPTDQELIDRTPLTWREVEQARETQGRSELSLSSHWDDEEHSSMEEHLADEGRPGAEEQLLMRERVRELDAAMEKLPPKEHFVIRHRFGIREAEVMTLKEIGTRLGCSRERARQIEVQARARLKRLLSPRFRTSSSSARLQRVFPTVQPAARGEARALAVPPDHLSSCQFRDPRESEEAV